MKCWKCGRSLALTSADWATHLAACKGGKRKGPDGDGYHKKPKARGIKHGNLI